MSTLILLRHGQSVWNKANLFTGWVDVPLTEQGIQEATQAGNTLSHLNIDVIFTSTLIRAQMTAMLAMQSHTSDRMPVLMHEEPDKMRQWSAIYDEQTQANCLPVYVDWRLNERYYGKLQGLNKQVTRERYGDDQVKIWRRSFDVPPPDGESLAMTAERTLPCLHERILPALNDNQNVLVSAHGNSLRSIVMDIESLSTEAVLELEIATGVPIIYDYVNQQFTRVDE